MKNHKFFKQIIFRLITHNFHSFPMANITKFWTKLRRAGSCIWNKGLIIMANFQEKKMWNHKLPFLGRSLNEVYLQQRKNSSVQQCYSKKKKFKQMKSSYKRTVSKKSSWATQVQTYWAIFYLSFNRLLNLHLLNLIAHFLFWSHKPKMGTGYL